MSISKTDEDLQRVEIDDMPQLEINFSAKGICWQIPEGSIQFIYQLTRKFIWTTSEKERI